MWLVPLVHDCRDPIRPSLSVLQVQGGQAGLSWLLMGLAAKLLAVAELSVQRTTAFTSLPASQVYTACSDVSDVLTA